jgi:hypothetical protein
VLLCTWTIAHQVETRVDFAATELVKDVESRWGAAVVQPAPSVRWVESGSVFTALSALPLDRQHVRVDARMNYRKRGLRYFSGFDFVLSAEYAVRNPHDRDIDLALVFPIDMDKSQVLLSELDFRVNGTAAALDLGAERNRLVWTGRVERKETCRFSIRYRARGLERFVYRLDPALPARDVRLHVGVRGGDNFDYPDDVLAATAVSHGDDGVALDWAFPSLESSWSSRGWPPWRRSCFPATVAGAWPGARRSRSRRRGRFDARPWNRESRARPRPGSRRSKGSPRCACATSSTSTASTRSRSTCPKATVSSASRSTAGPSRPRRTEAASRCSSLPRV